MTKTVVFDFDDTLIAGDSILFWNAFLYSKKPKLRFFLLFYWIFAIFYAIKLIKIHTLKRWQLMATSRLSEAERQFLAQEFVSKELCKYVYPQIRQRLVEYQKMGYRVIIASASPQFYLDQIGVWLKTEVWGTEMIFPQTGILKLPKYISENFKGEQKAQRIIDENINTDQLIVYTDHYTDIPLLKLAAFKFLVNPHPKLEDWAKEFNHQTLRPFRLWQNPARNRTRLRLLLRGQGNLDNRVSSQFDERAELLEPWIQYILKWAGSQFSAVFIEELKSKPYSKAKGRFEFDHFISICKKLKGIPLYMTAEFFSFIHPSTELDFFDSVFSETFEHHLALDPIYPTAYGEWSVFSEEILQKNHIHGAQLMHFWDSEFIRQKLNDFPQTLQDYILSCLERIESITDQDFNLQGYWDRNEVIQNPPLEHPYLITPPIRPILKNNLIEKLESPYMQGISLKILKEEHWIQENSYWHIKSYLNSVFFELLQKDFLLFLSLAPQIKLLSSNPHPQFYLQDHSNSLKLIPQLGKVLYDHFQNQSPIPEEFRSSLGCNENGLLNNGKLLSQIPIEENLNALELNSLNSLTQSIVIAFMQLHKAF